MVLPSRESLALISDYASWSLLRQMVSTFCAILMVSMCCVQDIPRD